MRLELKINVVKLFAGAVLLLFAVGCAKESVHKPRENARLTLMRIIAASSENACTHLLRVSNLTSEDMTSKTVIILSASETSRTYRKNKERCFKMIDEEIKRLREDQKR